MLPAGNQRHIVSAGATHVRYSAEVRSTAAAAAVHISSPTNHYTHIVIVDVIVVFAHRQFTASTCTLYSTLNSSICTHALNLYATSNIFTSTRGASSVESTTATFYALLSPLQVGEAEDIATSSFVRTSVCNSLHDNSKNTGATSSNFL